MSKRPRELSSQLEVLSTLLTPPVEEAGNIDEKTGPSKLVRVDSATQQIAIVCSEKPLCQSRPFSTYEEYEVHYHQTHTNRCIECKKNFPSERFLHLHIQETHDPLSQIKFERGDKIFGCFVDGCDRMCSTPFKRKRHLIDKHCFPQDYNFFVTKDGIDRSMSLLNDGGRNPLTRSSHGNRRPKQMEGRDASPTLPEITPDVAMQVEDGALQKNEDDGINEISALMTSIRFVPPSVRFGRRR